jgi:hypothetical protein
MNLSTNNEERHNFIYSIFIIINIHNPKIESQLLYKNVCFCLILQILLESLLNPLILA